MKTKILSLFWILNTFSLASLSAEPILFDDFENYAPPTLKTGGNHSFRAANGINEDDSEGRYSIIAEDVDDHFGKGTGNRFLLIGRRTLENSNDNNIHSRKFEGMVTGQVSFDFYLADSAFSGGSGFQLSLWDESGITSDFPASSVVTSLFIHNDRIQLKKAGDALRPGTEMQVDIPSAQKNSLAIVFNHSSSNFDYPGGTIAPNQFDLWVNDRKVATWDFLSGSAVTSGSEIIAIWMRVFGTTQGEIALDNFYVGPPTVGSHLTAQAKNLKE